MTDIMEPEFGPDDVSLTVSEDQHAAGMVAVSMARSATRALAYAVSSGTGQIVLNLPDYEPHTARVLASALATLAESLDAIQDAHTDDTHTIEQALRRLGISEPQP